MDCYGSPILIGINFKKPNLAMMRKVVVMPAGSTKEVSADLIAGPLKRLIYMVQKWVTRCRTFNGKNYLAFDITAAFLAKERSNH